ncbi:MAG TPA: hypothetical protein DE060_08185 [Lentisphaeria bacterium]|nr:hypothetical protein [Lentisphaeria bacterium]HCG49167.1 hypothetical protein [Lentisphaeria bacterium]
MNPKTGGFMNQDRFHSLPAGAVRLHGVMGKALRLTTDNRLKKVDYRKLVDPFRFRNEKDNLWRCEFWGKIVRSAILAWHGTQDAELLQIIRDTVRDMLSTQTPDGCISSYPAEKQTGGWDIWGRKYVLLALLRYYNLIEHDEQVLNACRGMLDHLMQQIPVTGQSMPHYGWHEGLAACSILGAVCGVAAATGEQRYRDYARRIVDSGCSLKHNIFEAARRHIPPAEIGNGKAYEMLSCFQGLSEFHLMDPQEEYLETVTELFRMVKEQEIFITGGGGLKDTVGEFWYYGAMRQTRDDSGNHGETCVTATWLHYCDRILKLTGSATAADCMERSFYNAMLGSMKPDGSWYIHANPSPLSGAGFKKAAPDQLPGFGEDCCLAQGPEGIAMASYTAVLGSHDGIVLNAYEPLTCSFNTPRGQTAELEVSGDYPWRETVGITLCIQEPERFTIRFRIPCWWKGRSVFRLNGKELPAVPGEYLALERSWSNADRVEILFDLTPEQVFSPDISRVGYLAGPVVLAQDSRLGKVNRPVPADGITQDTENPGNEFHLVKRLSDGTLLCDYASAGNRFSMDNRLTVWMKRK